MRLNYTRRLVLAMGGYTFVLMLILLSLAWQLIESTVQDETEVIAGYLAPALEMAWQHRGGPAEILSTAQFDLYPPAATVPAAFGELQQPGYQVLNDGRRLLVGVHPVSGERYYVAFHEAPAQEYLESEFDDVIVIIAAVLIATALAIFIVALVARRLAAPVVALTRQVEQLSASSQELPLMERDDEIGQLSRAFSAQITRLREFASREQEFTRFASHELRSPVTVIRGNLDLLRESLPDTPLNQRILSRMNAATRRMSLLIDGFLWLGRERREDLAVPTGTIAPAQFRALLDQSLEGMSPANQQRVVVEIGALHWQLKPLMLSIVLDNLLRNALQHGGEQVRVTAQGRSLMVSNSLEEASDTRQHGIGLQIVNRICEANGWRCGVQSGEERFTVTIRFEG